MKWLEFAIWMWREMGLRAFFLFLMGLWAISWALVPGPKAAGPRMLHGAGLGEGAGLATREKGPWVCASPHTIIAGQLCLFRRAGSLDCYVKKKLTTMFTREVSWDPVTALAPTVLSAQGEKQRQDPQQRWETEMRVVRSRQQPGLRPGAQAAGLVARGCRNPRVISHRAVTANKGLVQSPTSQQSLVMLPWVSGRYFWSQEAASSAFCIKPVSCSKAEMLTGRVAVSNSSAGCHRHQSANRGAVPSLPSPNEN